MQSVAFLIEIFLFKIETGFYNDPKTTLIFLKNVVSKKMYQVIKL